MTVNRMQVAAFALVALVWMPGAAQAGGPGGHIGLYTDIGFSNCGLYESVGTQNYIYVVHDLAPEANTSQFMIQDYWGAPHTGADFDTNLYLGDPYTGVTVTYVGCKALPYLLCTLSVTPTAPSGPCAGENGLAMEVVPDPHLSSGQIEVVSCDTYTILSATGGFLLVNPDPLWGCSCLWDPPIGTEETTWSRVKALYQ